MDQNQNPYQTPAPELDSGPEHTRPSRKAAVALTILVLLSAPAGSIAGGLTCGAARLVETDLSYFGSMFAGPALAVAITITMLHFVQQRRNPLEGGDYARLIGLIVLACLGAAPLVFLAIVFVASAMYDGETNNSLSDWWITIAMTTLPHLLFTLLALWIWMLNAPRGEQPPKRAP